MIGIVSYAHRDEDIPHGERVRVRYRGLSGTTVGRVIMMYGCWLRVRLDNGQQITVVPSAVEIDSFTIPPVPQRGLRLVRGDRA